MKIEKEGYSGKLINVGKGTYGISCAHVAPVIGMITTGGKIVKISKRSFVVAVIHTGEAYRNGSYTELKQIDRRCYGVGVSLTEARKFYKELRR